MSPVIATLVLQGGRVGEELGGMAFLELGSALAAVTTERCDPEAPDASTVSPDGDAKDTPGSCHKGRAPSWVDDTPPRAAASGASASISSRHIATVVPGVRFPSLDVLRAAVRRCALIRVALLEVAAGSPVQVAEALGPTNAARCAAQVLAPGRKGVSRQVLEDIGAQLWDAGVGGGIVANRVWLETCASGGADFFTKATADVTPHYYVHPENMLGEVVAWGMERQTALRTIDAPNAMPPEQAVLAVNAARVRFGDVVVDPCVGGGAVAFAALALGAGDVIGGDVCEDALMSAKEAACRYFGLKRDDGIKADGSQERVERNTREWRRAENDETNENNETKFVTADARRSCTFAFASLLDDPAATSQSVYSGLKNSVDAIVTDLPYGVRSASIGIGDVSGEGLCSVTPGDMLDALLRLANYVLKTNGRVAVWLRRVVQSHPETKRVSGTVSPEGNDVDTTDKKETLSGGMPVEEVKARCAKFGFTVERHAAEHRKTGVQRALYVLVRDTGNTESDEALVSNCSVDVNQDPVDAALDGSCSETNVSLEFAELSCDEVGTRFSEEEDAGKRNALIMHCVLRRNENHARVVAGGGVDVWRGAWLGDVSFVSRILETGAHKHIAHVREPAGAKNTPLFAASGFGRLSVVEAILTFVSFDQLETNESGVTETSETKNRRYTATHRAAERGHTLLLSSLLAKGGDPLTTRPEHVGGGNALHAAAERGHACSFEALVTFSSSFTKETSRMNWLESALETRDDSGRVPVLCAARRGHADVVTCALRAMDTISVRQHHARNAAVEAARWGHVDAARNALFFLDGVDKKPKSAHFGKLVKEAERWRRDAVLQFLENLSHNNQTEEEEEEEEASTPDPRGVPKAIDGASLVWHDAETSASLSYAADFFMDPGTVSEMLRQFEPLYLPRDHALVTPADRRGEKAAVPRDQAYYAVRYEGRDDEFPDFHDIRSGTEGDTRDAYAKRDSKQSHRVEVETPSTQTRVWFASYRYNPDKTQQPTPCEVVPAELKALVRKIYAVSGQMCNHVVVNRYKNGTDAIGAHADKSLDLEKNGFVVSCSFGATRVMTFSPRRWLEGDGGDGGDGGSVLTGQPSSEGSEESRDSVKHSIGPDVVKRKRKLLLEALRRDPEWRVASQAKANAPPRSEVKRQAVERERVRTAWLRENDERVIAAAAKCDAARQAWFEYKHTKMFHLALEHGSAVFFNMAFNEQWTHAIDAVGNGRVKDDDNDEHEDSDEEDDAETTLTSVHDAETSGQRVPERVGVTLRRCHTVFDPDLCAKSHELPRARRKDAWRSVSEMANVKQAEARWVGN